MLAQFGEDLLRGFGGVDFFGDAGELGLVFVEVVEGDAEETIEGDVDHLVVAEFFCEGLCTEFVVAIGAGEKVGFHPCRVGLEGVDDGGVGFCEVGFGFGISGGVSGRRRRRRGRRSGRS